MIFAAENSHEHAGYKNESKEPFQCQYERVISARDSHAFISDLFDVTEAVKRGGLGLFPRQVFPAMLFRQQIKMKLQLLVYFELSLPPVQTSK